MCRKSMTAVRHAVSTTLLLFFCFFFSSRRRHTRLQGDWSSDVCSSDLSGLHRLGSPPHPLRHERREQYRCLECGRRHHRRHSLWPGRNALCHRREQDRSEEHTSELQSPCNLVCRLLLEKKNNKHTTLSSHSVPCRLHVPQSEHALPHIRLLGARHSEAAVSRATLLALPLPYSIHLLRPL